MRFSLILIVALFFCANISVAQRPRNLGVEWLQLFNGKDLSGWKEIGNEKWVVEDGAIYGEGVTKEYGYLATEKKYKDFHLFLRFKCEASGNSGVYIHAAFEPGTANVTQGRQIEIDQAVGKHTGGIYGDGKGWIVWPATELETVIRSDDWNEMLIKVEGNRYITILNGVQMIDFTYPAPDATEGVIALQLHSGGQGRMRFRKIWIRDLSKEASRVQCIWWGSAKPALLPCTRLHCSPIFSLPSRCAMCLVTGLPYIPAGQLESTAHGVLAVYDLPDLVNLVGKEKIRFEKIE